MTMRGATGAWIFLATAFPSAEANMRPYDPKLCYILDGFLLLYCIVMTGFFVRERFFKNKTRGQGDSTYAELNKPSSGQYDILNRRTDPESGIGQRGRRADESETYTRLQKKTDDTYREIHVKPQDRRRNKNEQVYQGLSAATKDTYDSLQMQPLPPPR